MLNYTLLHGETVQVDSAPAEDFIARVRILASDPGASVAELVDLVYGEENPVLKRGVIPGRGLVTPEVYDDPAYQVMVDLVNQKRIQLGTLRLDDAVAERLTVTETAERLGISRAAVLKAIAEGRLPAIRRGNKYLLRAEAVAAYKPGRQGGRSASTVSPVSLRIGTEADAVIQIRHDGAVDRRKEGAVVIGTLTDWSEFAIKTARKAAGTVRLFRCRPAGEEQEIVVGGLSVRGRFEIFEKINNRQKALATWRALPYRDGKQLAESG